MKVILKHQFYFELTVADGTDRKIVSESFERHLRPQFDQLLSSIKFDDSDRAALFKLVGKDIKVRLLTSDQFKKIAVKDTLQVSEEQ